MSEELLFQRRQHGDALPGCFLLLADVLTDTRVVDDGSRLDGCCQLQAFQRPTTAQRHIYLTGCKRHIGIDDGVFEGQSLALMNGDGPRQP